ncbi:MAG: Ig-like domain-containing protein [Aquabacterium sp.]
MTTRRARAGNDDAVGAKPMMQRMRWLALLGLGLLAACGGGGGGGDSVFGGGDSSKTAADISLTLSSPTVNNSGSETVTATVTAVDANRNTVEGVTITLAVDNGGTIQVSGTKSSASGVVTGTVGIGAIKINRSLKVTATSGSLTKTLTIQVVGTRLTSTLIPAVLPPGSAGKVQYRLLDINSNPMVGVDLTVTGPTGQQVITSTGANGDYEFSYTAPATAGTYDIRAAAGGVENLQSVIVQAGQGAIPPVVTAVQSASVSANPSVVPINTAGTNNRSEIRAIFLAANNAPVRNIRVRFDLAGDPNSIGGTFTSDGSQVYSDANGVATTAYVPGSRFSPTDGVVIRACWDYNDFNAGACPNEVRNNLTVISDALSVSIGTNAAITSDSSGLLYIKRYVVQVVDSSGRALKDVQISPSLDLLQYEKGFYEIQGDSWVKVTMATCDNEDLNRNGQNEIFSNGVVEDANNSFNLVNGRAALEPRKGDVAWSFVGSGSTDETGRVVVQLQYPQDVGSWDRFNLTVAASGVAGSEGRSNFSGLLPVPAAVLADIKATPPFVLSPYGVQASGTIAVSMPSSSKVHVLCTNPN